MLTLSVSTCDATSNVNSTASDFLWPWLATVQSLSFWGPQFLSCFVYQFHSSLQFERWDTVRLCCSTTDCISRYDYCILFQADWVSCCVDWSYQQWRLLPTCVSRRWPSIWEYLPQRIVLSLHEAAFHRKFLWESGQIMQEMVLLRLIRSWQ